MQSSFQQGCSMVFGASIMQNAQVTCHADGLAPGAHPLVWLWGDLAASVALEGHGMGSWADMSLAHPVRASTSVMRSFKDTFLCSIAGIPRWGEEKSAMPAVLSWWPANHS
jgi:hypothetical protein